MTELSALLDWSEIEQALAGISAAAKGEQGWPPLALFRAMLLAIRHDLSDVRLAEALDDRASFRRFCGFALHEPTPERTAFVRLRTALCVLVLTEPCLILSLAQSHRRGVVVRTGALVDATLLPSASSAFASSRPEAAIRARGGTPHVIHTGTWGGAAARAQPARPQRAGSPIRCRIDKGLWQLQALYGMRRMRWLGLATSGLQVKLTAIAYNLRRSWRLFAAAPA